MLKYIFSLILLAASAEAIILDSTTKTLEVETSAAVSTDYYVSYADHTTTAFTPADSEGNISTATTTTIVAAPGASTQRQVRYITLVNRSTTASQTVRFKIDVSGTERHISGPTTLAPSESLKLNENGAIIVYDATGNEKKRTDSVGVAGAVYAWQKAGTAKDAAGYWIAYGKDAGFPGAMNLGTPGVNGTGTDCSVATSGADPRGAAELGAHVLPDPASGALYLTQADFISSNIETIQLIDVLWYNTGLTVTTTTAQNITFGTLQARDLNGTSNGEGVYAALYALTALGNAAAVANTTISYTDESGNAGATGTFSGVVGWQAPATPVIGTWMPFQLAAGDRGIRSLQSITLGTTYTSGTMALILYRPLATVPVIASYTGNGVASYSFQVPPGVRIYPNSCIWAISVANGTTASNITGTYSIIER